MSGFVLLHPWFLLLAPLVLLVPGIRRRRGRGAGLLHAPSGLFAAPGGPRLPRSWRVRLLPATDLLLVLGLLLAVVALARPVRRVPLPLRTAGADVILCLDLSSSMAAKDLDRDRTRLEVAKEAAARFVEARPEDRIGLLGFARWPDLRCPPTLDHGALLGMLRALEPVRADGPEDATGIGGAAARAARALREGGTRSRVAVLLTDGEENVALTGSPTAIAPAHAALLCRELGVRVYAVLAGAAAPGPGATDTRSVEEMAAATGGRFFRARDAAALAAVYGEIDALERTPFERPRLEVEEGFFPFAAGALVLLLLGRLLGATILRVLP